MKSPISGWLITGTRGHAMQCGPGRPSMTVIHGNDPVVSMGALYGQDVIDAMEAEIAKFRLALNVALPYLEDIRDALGGLEPPDHVQDDIDHILTALNQQEHL